jgi:serine/threonine-protein kinase
MAIDGRSRGDGRYVLERRLGVGGMATVYGARDTVLGRPVALKALAENLAADPSFRARFLREARLAARLHHPNVVQVFDAGEDAEGLFIVMELVDGETLAHELSRRGRLPPDEVAALGIALADGLAAAHEAGLVHRDVKPRNVLRGRGGAVKLGDFGIASSAETTALTEEGSVLGTAAYLAPEQARGLPAGPAADLYALGVVLYEALAGRRPYEADSLQELVLRREREPVVPPGRLVAGVPAGLEAAILACLAVDPAARPPSAAALGEALAGDGTVATAPHAVATEAPTTVHFVAARRRRRWMLGAILLVLACGLGLAAAVAWSGGGDPGAAGTTTKRKAATTRPHTTTTTRATPAADTTSTTRPRVVAAQPKPPAPTPAPPSPCAALEAARQRLDDRRHALDVAKHATKDKAQHHALDAEKHALDRQKHALDQQRHGCK